MRALLVALLLCLAGCMDDGEAGPGDEPGGGDGTDGGDGTGDDTGGDGTGGDGTDGSDGEHAIDIQDFSFGGDLEISVGDTVVWTNQDTSSHTVTADEGAFDSGSLAQGETFEHTFSEAGTFSYFCEFHPNMQATITVG